MTCIILLNQSIKQASLSGGNSERVPPDPISNSEVKTLCADDSVGLPCESRSPPDVNLTEKPSSCRAAFLLNKGL